MATGLSKTMRVYHRYLGFFLAGIMAIYAVSGILMIFRDTDFLKRNTSYSKNLASSLPPEELGKELKMRDFKVQKTEGDIVYFKEGTYNSKTGVAAYSVKELPTVLKKITNMHKATSKSPLFFLNVFFGISLLFFVLSSFWMFMPGTTIFKKGMYFTLGGIALALIVIFV